METEIRCRQARQALHVDALVQTAGLPLVRARTLDIGLSGMHISATANLKSNARCRITFSLPDRGAGPCLLEL